jgi:transcriptional regulator with XRE-family HTH domain
MRTKESIAFGKLLASLLKKHRLTEQLLGNIMGRHASEIAEILAGSLPVSALLLTELLDVLDKQNSPDGLDLVSRAKLVDSWSRAEQSRDPSEGLPKAEKERLKKMAREAGVPADSLNSVEEIISVVARIAPVVAARIWKRLREWLDQA